MEWKYNSDELSGDSRLECTTDRGFYDIIHTRYINTKNCYYIIYTPSKNIGGYVSNGLRMYSLGTIRVDLLPNDCFYATQEEAKEVCKRHYELLVLQ
jgi:hypothetical protein